jgi:hypothetical protein
MFFILNARRIKPGTQSEYVEASRPRELPPGFLWGYQGRSLSDENVIVSFGLVDRKLSFFTDTMSKDSDFVSARQRRQDDMAPFVEEILMDGIFEVVDEMKEEEF